MTCTIDWINIKVWNLFKILYTHLKDKIMSKILVREQHQLGAADARTRIGTFEEMLNKYMIKLVWNDDMATFKGPVNGHIKVGDNFIEVELKLGMAAKMLGIDPTRLEASIRKRLKAGLAS